MKKSIQVFNILMLISILIGDFIFLAMGHDLISHTNTTRILVKGITSGLFVIVGIVNTIYAGLKNRQYIKFALILLVGLIFSMLGDIFLEIYFIIGAGLFGLGHIFFLISYCFISKFRFRDMIYGVLFFLPALLILLFVPIFDFGSTLMLMVCIAYAFVISMMLGKALSNHIAVHSVLTLVILIGSILFFFSDVMLLFSVFGKIQYIDILCLISYYPAQFLLALSTLITMHDNGLFISKN